MNRFRTKKKTAKDDISAPRPSIDTESSSAFKMFARSKKSIEEPKREVDLTAALPPSDDFRTSLLMTGLSARFSMLREQDDPNTKVGKASDDSVLFPKRQSRLDLFGGGLHDIAEVESIRAPFARMDSFYSSDDGASTSGVSIMNRAKPTEGNNLFGGRQKIYKISASGNSKDGGLPGRALYGDDVAQSSFQRWRQAERENRSFEEDRSNGTLDADSHLDYSHRRETNSTTSSAPSAARNSTAATSINSSQPAPSLKDWQPPVTAPNATSQGAFLERTVTRTRRLYEQGLTQDMHDQQSSAVSRMDTLSKRPFGSRTPDLTPSNPSPTASNFDRFSERRPIMTKASAPNLRSFSPPTTSSSQAASPAESSNKFPGLEQKPGYGASPPLSPPISETEDYPTLAIGPNDRGKATAMGVFTRPMHQYDDSKYAQLQRQLQQGRDTPTNRFRTESNASNPTTRSRSSSSLRRAQFDKSEQAPVKTEPTVQEEANHTFFDDDDDDATIPEQPTRAPPAPVVTLERPNDHDHPAFRKSALPTPLTVSRRNSTEGLSAEKSSNAQESPEDSPTLGPPSGLSGMVRQHLRNVSTASSVYGAAPESEDDTQQYDEPANSKLEVQLDTNGWGLNEDEWNLSYGEENHAVKPVSEASRDAAQPRDNAVPAKEQDEFARHLADGARRVREKLTSYAEPDSGRSTPLATPHSDASRELAPPTNPLGLRSKDSRTSLASRDREPEDADYLKNLQHKSMDASEESFDERPAGDQSPPPKEEKVHAGLKAFRQARRELQRMKQADVQQRRNPSLKSPTQEQAPTRQAPPPPKEHGSPRSVSQGSSDRGRSGSEASNGGLSNGQLRPIAYDESHRSGAAMRSPASLPAGTPPAGSFRTGSSQSLNVRRGYESGQASPISGTPSPFSNGPTNGLGSAASTPNLYGVSAPPLPPINPRRKNVRGNSSYGDSEESAANSPRLPASPSHHSERSSAPIMSDDASGPDQFRQRLRKVPSDINGPDGRPRMRQSPPRGVSRGSSRGPQQNMNHGMTNGLPGGMI